MTIPTNAVTAVLAMLELLDSTLEHGGKLVSLAKQQHPELDLGPVPDAGAEMDDARAEAHRRAKEG